MKLLNINLGDRSYEIRIGRGILQNTAEWVLDIAKPSRVVIITHPSINKLYGQTLSSGFSDSNVPTDFIEVPDGEKSKSLVQTEQIYDHLLKLKCDRQTVLIALGGGVIGDLTGFIAATYMRGVPFIQVPTTLLSQVDSSVGGKTAVNHPLGKNMIGVFYQPILVVIDIETLNTLPEKEYRAGIAEIVKYGVIEDANLFDFLEQKFQQILSQDSDSLEHIIFTSCSIKARVVEKDEFESHYRMVLNFGHTIGHTIESLTSYSTFIHGEAVSIGMVYAAKLSHVMDYCDDEVVQRITTLIINFGLPSRLPDLNIEDMIQTMYLDKKTAHKMIRFIVVKDIGSIEIVDNVDPSFILEALQS